MTGWPSMGAGTQSSSASALHPIVVLTSDAPRPQSVTGTGFPLIAHQMRRIRLEH